MVSLVTDRTPPTTKWMKKEDNKLSHGSYTAWMTMDRMHRHRPRIVRGAIGNGSYEAYHTNHLSLRHESCGASSASDHTQQSTKNNNNKVTSQHHVWSYAAFSVTDRMLHCRLQIVYTYMASSATHNRWYASMSSLNKSIMPLFIPTFSCLWYYYFLTFLTNS